jgi:hypothetical protein
MNECFRKRVRKMRRAFFTAIAALVVLAGASPATAVPAGDSPEVRYYEGPTSEGAGCGLASPSQTTAWPGSACSRWPYTCAGGTEGKTEAGVGWLRRGSPTVADQRVELSENWGVIAFRGSGRIGARRGSETLTFLLPALTANEQAQVCTMGELTTTCVAIRHAPDPRLRYIGRH